MREAILTLFLFFACFIIVTIGLKREYKMDRCMKEMEVIRDIAEVAYAEYTSKYLINYYMAEARMDDMIMPRKKLKNMKKQAERTNKYW